MRAKNKEIITINTRNWRMSRRLLGFFSGFPSRRFPREVAERLRAELTRRESLVFVSAWPEDFAKNDGDSAGMHGMFEEYGMPFARHCVIDSRIESSRAARLIREASCVFFMGGHPGMQIKLIHELGLDEAIRKTEAAVLGVSAGAINMAVRALDTKESPVPYDGLGLAGITVKPHFEPEDREVISVLTRISSELPICAMEDDSAIFVKNGRVSYTGRVYLIDKGKISLLSQDKPMLPG